MGGREFRGLDEMRADDGAGCGGERGKEGGSEAGSLDGPV